MTATSQRALATRDGSGHLVVAGANYGQGSSREHAVIAPRYLGLRAVLAVSFARIHWQNLANFGVLALEFADPDDYQRIEQGDVLALDGLRHAIALRRHRDHGAQHQPRAAVLHPAPAVRPADRDAAGRWADPLAPRAKEQPITPAARLARRQVNMKLRQSFRIHVPALAGDLWRAAGPHIGLLYLSSSAGWRRGSHTSTRRRR